MCTDLPTCLEILDLYSKPVLNDEYDFKLNSESLDHTDLHKIYLHASETSDLKILY